MKVSAKPTAMRENPEHSTEFPGLVNHRPTARTLCDCGPAAALVARRDLYKTGVLRPRLHDRQTPLN